MRKGGRNGGKPEGKTKKVENVKKTETPVKNKKVEPAKTKTGNNKKTESVKKQNTKIDFAEGLNFKDELGGKSEYEINQEKIKANEAEIARLQARLNAQPAGKPKPTKKNNKKAEKERKKAEARKKKAAKEKEKLEAKKKAEEARKKADRKSTRLNSSH